MIFRHYYRNLNNKYATMSQDHFYSWTCASSKYIPLNFAPMLNTSYIIIVEYIHVVYLFLGMHYFITFHKKTLRHFKGASFEKESTIISTIGIDIGWKSNVRSTNEHNGFLSQSGRNEDSRSKGQGFKSNFQWLWRIFELPYNPYESPFTRS